MHISKFNIVNVVGHLIEISNHLRKDPNQSSELQSRALLASRGKRLTLYVKYTHAKPINAKRYTPNAKP